MNEDLTNLQVLTLEEVCKRPLGNEITGTAIARAIGLKPRRSGMSGADMRSIIHALRVKGFPICANGKGYYWAQTPKEISEYVDLFRGRIEDQERACEGMKANRSYEPIDIVEL